MFKSCFWIRSVTDPHVSIGLINRDQDRFQIGSSNHQHAEKTVTIPWKMCPVTCESSLCGPGPGSVSTRWRVQTDCPYIVSLRRMPVLCPKPGLRINWVCRIRSQSVCVSQFVSDLSMFISVCLSMSLSVHVSLCPSPSVSVCLSLSQSPPLCLSLFLFVSVSLSLSQYVSICLCLSQYVSLCLSLPLFVLVCLGLSQSVSVCLCLSLSQSVSVCPCLSQSVSVCLT